MTNRKHRKHRKKENKKEPTIVASLDQQTETTKNQYIPPREDRICPKCGKEFKNSVIQTLTQHIFRAHTEKGKTYNTWGKETRKLWKKRRDQRDLYAGNVGNKNPLFWTKFQCAFCNKEHEIRTVDYRKRIKHSKSGKLFCNEKCLSRYGFSAELDSKVIQQSILRAEFQCEACGYDEVYTVYYIIPPVTDGFKYDPANSIVLCPNCRVLWKTGKATVEKETRMFNKAVNIDKPKEYDIDSDMIFKQIGEIEDLIEKNKENNEVPLNDQNDKLSP